MTDNSESDDKELSEWLQRTPHEVLALIVSLLRTEAHSIELLTSAIDQDPDAKSVPVVKFGSATIGFFTENILANAKEIQEVLDKAIIYVYRTRTASTSDEDDPSHDVF